MRLKCLWGIRKEEIRIRGIKKKKKKKKFGRNRCSNRKNFIYSKDSGSGNSGKKLGWNTLTQAGQEGPYACVKNENFQKGDIGIVINERVLRK